VRARVGRPFNPARAALSVAPVVATSSIRTALERTGIRPVNPTRLRRSRFPPAWRGHHTGARRALTTGSPVEWARAAASSAAGSTPNRRRRTTARGTGTRAVTEVGSKGTIAAAKNPATSRRPRYFSERTSVRAAASWANGARTRSPSARTRSGAGASELAQRAQSEPGTHRPQARQTIPTPYRGYVTVPGPSH
jgi:hypothetical protein